MWKRSLLLSGAVTVQVVVLALRGIAAEPNGNPPSTKIVNSRIRHVTVYPNSALVTREVEVPAGTGVMELMVTPMPAQTINSSLYSEGSDGIRVLTTRFRTRPIKEDTREEVRKLEDEIHKLQQTCERLQADQGTIEQNLKMLAKLEDFTAASTRASTEKSALNSESVIALTKYVMDCRGEKSKELVGLKQQWQASTEQMEFAKRQRGELSAGTTRVERDAIIIVDKINAAAGKVKLNYLVDAAAWKPQYKFRAAKDEKGPVQVEYLAAVIQQTGEAWNDVNVTLSTAAPTLNASPPELKSLEVAVVPHGGANPQPMPSGITNPTRVDFANKTKELFRQAVQSSVQKDSMNYARLANEAAAVDQTWQLLFSSREEMLSLNKGKRGQHRDNNDEGPSVTYDIATRLSVPSRPDEQVIEVARRDMEAEFFYKAVPVLAAHVYRQANLTNKGDPLGKSDLVLLPGEATMYLGSDFVGRMNLPLVAIGEQFSVGFGIDPQLQVQRQMMDKNRTTEGGNQVLKFEYRILVSSYKKEVVAVQIWDRLPHAEKEAVGINLLKTTPELSKDGLYLRESRPQNLLRWDLKVEPSMNGEKALPINYEFQMALDKQSGIGGFQTK